jgi:hypothetical protein
LLAFAALVVNVLVWGAHAYLPWRLPAAGEAARRGWALAALPALATSVVLTLATLARQPDAAIAWGMTGPLAAWPARWVALAVVALAAVDLLLLIGWRRFGPGEWRLAGGVGGLGLLVQSTGSELLRIGWGPVPGLVALWLAIGLRLPLALGAGELLLGRPRLWPPVAGAALLASWFLWPVALRQALLGDLVTLLAAVALLGVARWLPGGLRRPAAAGGLLLGLLLLARAGAVSAILGTGETLPEALLGP